VTRVLAEGAYADRALHAEARALPPRERALAKQLAFGAIQRRLTLDHLIDRHASGPLDPPVRAALQLGLLQLLFLEGIADHAAVSEAVELAKPSPGHRLVNAVLRRVQREGAELPSDATPAGAAIRHSHPEWLVRMWWEELGADGTRALLAANNEPAELALRVNRLAGDVALDDVPGRREGDAIVVDGPFDAFGHPGWAAGWFTPQSRASQLVAPIVAPAPGERVLDLCAAPGGKTTHLAALMEGRGEVVAVERHPGRAEALRRTCERLHARNVTVVCADAREFGAARGFDRVLLDPPCSGLGTLRSHPDLRWRVRPDDVERLAAEQDALLAAARAALRPDGPGVLVFSVCTISRREERLRGRRRWRTMPHRDGTDGFYIARDGG
jgi:16S rRNA (cytosine967-C5)-methyltransferase